MVARLRCMQEVPGSNPGCKRFIRMTRKVTLGKMDAAGFDCFLVFVFVVLRFHSTFIVVLRFNFHCCFAFFILVSILVPSFRCTKLRIPGSGNFTDEPLTEMFKNPRFSVNTKDTWNLAKFE